MPLFLIYISQIGIETSSFIYSNFCLGVAWWCGRDVVWRLVLFWVCIDVIVVRVKVSRGIEPFSPMEIDSADTSQPPNWEICMDQSHILPK
jgi:hypothetical protein